MHVMFTWLVCSELNVTIVHVQEVVVAVRIKLRRQRTWHRLAGRQRP